MNLFDQLQPLTQKVGIVIPSTTDVNKKIDNSMYVEYALIRLSKLFGGATAVNQSGGWVSDEHELVLENSVMVYAYADKLDNDTLNKVYIHAETLAKELNQDAIAVEINNRLYFVEQTREKKVMHVG